MPALAAKLLKAFRKRSLPTEFAWIENVRRVMDSSLVDELDTELETRLDSGNHAGIRLAIPEITNGSMGMDAKFLRPDGPNFDPSVATYLASRSRSVGSTLQAAKRSHSVVLVDGAGTEKHSFPVYKCIVAEVQFKDAMYMLADGEWFSLDKDFVADVNAAVGGISQLSHGFPAWRPNEHEGDWNTRACQHCTDAALLDKSNIAHGGSHSRIETADVLTRKRMLGHVKRRDRNSSGLSHLFAQGEVAATLLSQDRSFRKKVAATLPKSHSPIATELRKLDFDPRKWTVGYILLGADPTRPAEGLPFFSKVNLRKHNERLRAMQYRVGIAGI